MTEAMRPYAGTLKLVRQTFPPVDTVSGGRRLWNYILGGNR